MLLAERQIGAAAVIRCPAHQIGKGPGNAAGLSLLEFDSSAAQIRSSGIAVGLLTDSGACFMF